MNKLPTQTQGGNGRRWEEVVRSEATNREQLPNAGDLGTHDA